MKRKKSNQKNLENWGFYLSTKIQTHRNREELMKAEVIPAFIWIYKSSNGITHDREWSAIFTSFVPHTLESKIRGDNYKTTSVLKWVTMIYNAQYPSKEIAHHFFSTSVQSERNNFFHKKIESFLLPQISLALSYFYRL